MLNDSKQLGHVDESGVTTGVTTLRDQVLEALHAFAERDEARERMAVDVLAKVAEHLDAAESDQAPKKKTPKARKKKRGAR
ncbi:MAG: hypothetical protein ABI461_02610 [Polyangiaceae bacterium]